MRHIRHIGTTSRDLHLLVAPPAIVPRLATLSLLYIIRPLLSSNVFIRVVKVFAVGLITRAFTMFLPAGKNTFGHGNMWQKLNFEIGWVLSAVL